MNGPFTKQIEVFSNDPEAGRTALIITGTVDPNAAEKVVDVKAIPEVKTKSTAKSTSKKKVKA